MKRYRVKTRKEFIDEYGNNWNTMIGARCSCYWADDDEVEYFFGKVLNEEANEEVNKIYREARSGFSLRDVDYRMQLKQCSMYWCDIRFHLIRIEDGEV